MKSKMLIDASHPEETRVVVTSGNRIEEFDFESQDRKQLRGNIYLARVTRVEPSLQAAFIEYGGNRHGFLAFSEIHPDYYQIPVADRKALLEEEAEEESRAVAEEEADFESGGSRRRKRGGRRKKADAAADGNGGEALEATGAADAVSEDAPAPTEDAAEGGESADGDPGADDETSADGNGSNGDNVESVGSEDALEELPVRARRRRKRIYKIQEVIKRRQIILVQVVKEERGNKGAALTTYLSLAGRYTVMMPNTARGGGISRKITNAPDRKRLRKIAEELDVAEGMGLIIRTAGASRTKTEIKRDFEYLLRLWENIRDLTLSSTAPTLVYEEGNLIKRSIRDLYNKEIDEILVAGDEAYKEAKAFMRMLMPSHAKNVKPYKDPEPIFVKYKIERQLSAMYSPYVTLKSGGYIVLNQTEALVSIDVNSGKSTREHSIEDTALKTNMEAAEEVSRQLRLRDLAGLIVIDFIDMEERRNNRSVERKLKESLRHDRARIQVGRISPFGLLEMSRQRLRAGMLEGSTDTCPMCLGTGIVRSTESVALDVLRSLEDTLMTSGVANLRASTSVDAALYILNHKRAMLKDIESRYGITILIEADKEQHGSGFTIEKTGTAERQEDDTVIQIDTVLQEAEAEQAEAEGEQGRKRSRRRRRRRGRGRGNGEAAASETPRADEQEEAGAQAEASAETQPDESEGAEKKPRRRGKRGGRRVRAARGAKDEAAAPESAKEPAAEGQDEAVAETAAEEEKTEQEKPKRRRSRKRTPEPAATAEPAESVANSEPVGEALAEAAQEPEAEPAAKPESNGRRARRGKKQVPSPEETDAAAPDETVVAEESARGEEESAEPRSGWWQRRA
jgi:ribonuclease E